MLDYLQSVFGAGIKVEPYVFPADVPFYIRDGYSARILSWGKNECLAVKPFDKSARLSALKKHIQTIAALCGRLCVLELDGVTAAQRRNLLESRIPFISDSRQIYLPFWGCVFSERFKKEIIAADVMPPSVQLVFLYLYYLGRGEPRLRMNLTQTAIALGVSKTSCTRAFEDLTEAGLFEQETIGKCKRLIPAMSYTKMLAKAFQRLRSPIEKTIYANSIPPGIPYQYGGILALSRISMTAAGPLDGAIAVSRKNAALFPKETLVSRRDFEDIGGKTVEVWRYDPAKLASGELVDEISLLLSLNADPDERVQRALDDIRKKHGLSVETQ